MPKERIVLQAVFFLNETVEAIGKKPRSMRQSVLPKGTNRFTKREVFMVVANNCVASTGNMPQLQ